MSNEKRLIDADGLISRFCELANRVTATDNWFHLDAITDEITDAPPVDAVEVVHGRWIGETGGYMWRQNCSICNQPVYNKMKPYYSYCPYCGAKMDGGNEDG